MNYFQYLLIGGQRHGSKHCEPYYQFNLFFRSQEPQAPDAIYTHFDYYKVNTIKALDGNWYLVAFYNAVSYFPLEEITSLLLENNVATYF